MKRWKTWVALFAVFAGGVAVGSVGTVGWVRGAVARLVRGGSPAAREILLRRIHRELKLDEAQRQTAEQVLARAQERLHELRLRTAPEVEAILGESMAEFKAVLSPGQRETADRLYAAARERWRVRVD